MNLSKTSFAKIASIKKRWLLIDAKNQVLGRLASQVAKILRGKHKAYYTPHIDCGDNVVVINAKKIKLTGSKMQDKIYFYHTGFPGGLKQSSPYKILSGNYPERVFKLSLKRMLPKESSLARHQFKCLYVYPGVEHPHNAQNPISINPINNR